MPSLRQSPPRWDRRGAAEILCQKKKRHSFFWWNWLTPWWRWLGPSLRVNGRTERRGKREGSLLMLVFITYNHTTCPEVLGIVVRHPNFINLYRLWAQCRLLSRYQVRARLMALLCREVDKLWFLSTEGVCQGSGYVKGERSYFVRSIMRTCDWSSRFERECWC